MLLDIIDVVDFIERSAAAHVNEYGVYAPLIEYLYDRLDTMKVYSKPGEKSCSVLAGFSLAVAAAKEWARKEERESESE